MDKPNPQDDTARREFLASFVAAAAGGAALLLARGNTAGQSLILSDPSLNRVVARLEAVGNVLRSMSERMQAIAPSFPFKPPPDFITAVSPILVELQAHTEAILTTLGDFEGRCGC